MFEAETWAIDLSNGRCLAYVLCTENQEMNFTTDKGSTSVSGPLPALYLADLATEPYQEFLTLILKREKPSFAVIRFFA